MDKARNTDPMITSLECILLMPREALFRGAETDGSPEAVGVL
jgi:hypothetical protein